MNGVLKFLQEMLGSSPEPEPPPYREVLERSDKPDATGVHPTHAIDALRSASSERSVLN